MRTAFAFALLLLAACSDESVKVDNALDQTLPNSQQPPLPGNDIAPAAPATKPRVDAGPSTTVTPNTVPAALLGRWTGAQDDCADKAAELELRVNPTTLVFHESVGTVTTIEPAADGRMIVQADFTGEGESWTRRLLLHPSADGQRLTITNDGMAVTRKRCGAA